jgi:hypothetical protein
MCCLVFECNIAYIFCFVPVYCGHALLHYIWSDGDDVTQCEIYTSQDRNDLEYVIYPLNRHAENSNCEAFVLPLAGKYCFVAAEHLHSQVCLA